MRQTETLHTLFSEVVSRGEGRTIRMEDRVDIIDRLNRCDPNDPEELMETLNLTIPILSSIGNLTAKDFLERIDLADSLTNWELWNLMNDLTDFLNTRH